MGNYIHNQSSLETLKQKLTSGMYERAFNASFNSSRINDPNTSFMSSEMVGLFMVEHGLEKISYENYYAFLSDRFEMDFKDYADMLTKHWLTIDPTINENTASEYLIKKFITDPVDGCLSELEVQLALEKAYGKENVIHSTPQQDIDECWDFEVNDTDNGFKFRVQHKPASFYYGLNGTTKNSFFKIKRASNKTDIPYFFSVIDKNAKSPCIVLMRADGAGLTNVHVANATNYMKTLNLDNLTGLSNAAFTGLETETRKPRKRYGRGFY